MKTRFAFTIMTISLSACVSSGNHMGSYDRPKVITPQVFACPGGEYARVKVYSPAEAVMGFAGKQYEMDRKETASGAKYAGDGAEFWSKGISAMITVDGRTHTCNFVPVDASGEEDLSLPGDSMPPNPAPEVYRMAPTPVAKPVQP